MDRKIYIDAYKLAISVRKLQPNTVQNYLGHSSSKTTERYTHLNSNDLMAEFNKTFVGFKEQELLLSNGNLLPAPN
jgi:integrase